MLNCDTRGASEARDGCQVSHDFSFDRPTHLEQVFFIGHKNIMFECNNDILVRTEFEVVCHNTRFVLLDLVVVSPALLEPPEIPWNSAKAVFTSLTRYHVFACGRYNGFLVIIQTCVETG